VGETTDTIKLYAAANPSVPQGVFELPKVVDHLRSMGVVEFAKVAANNQNRELAAKYQAEKNFMVVLSPDGRRIGSWNVVDGNLNTIMAQARVTIAAWENQFGMPKP